MDSTRAGGTDGIGAGEERAASEQADVRSEPAAAKPVAESFAPSRLAALDRAERPAEMPGGLLVAASLEIAEDHGCPITLGQLLDLFVEQTIEIVVVHGVRLRSRRGRALFVPSPAGGGQAARDAVRKAT